MEFATGDHDVALRLELHRCVGGFTGGPAVTDVPETGSWVIPIVDTGSDQAVLLGRNTR